MPQLPSPWVHPSSSVDADAILAAGVKVWHFCHICSGASIGAGTSLGQGCYVGPKVAVGARCKIQNHVSLFEGVEVEDDCFIGPHVCFSNILTPRAEISRRGEFLQTIVRKGASIGANATIVCGLEIGSYAMVGAGSVVTKSVPAYALVYGNPARQQGWVNRRGEKVDAPPHGSS